MESSAAGRLTAGTLPSAPRGATPPAVPTGRFATGTFVPASSGATPSAAPFFHRDIVRQFRQVRGRHLAGGVQRRHAPGHALLGGGNRGVGRGLGFGGSLCRVRRGQLHRVDAGLHLGEVGVDFGHSVAQRVTRAIIVLLANGDLFKFLHSLYGTCRCVNVTEIVYQPPPIATN